MDCREIDHKWYDEFSEKGMTLTFTRENGDGEEVEITVRAQFDVCDVCDGKGSHVNPSIDSHGISAEEFADDPDFADSYFAGDYDVQCSACGGRRVVPVVADDESADARENAERAMTEHSGRQVEYAREREMG
jgi:hypothetical protein